jgi:hypothetical protein
MEPETHSRFSEALAFAASHFLNNTNDLSGDEIYAALTGDDEEFQNSGIRLWTNLTIGREEVADIIYILAEDFINFLDKQ